MKRMKTWVKIAFVTSMVTVAALVTAQHTDRPAESTVYTVTAVHGTQYTATDGRGHTIKFDLNDVDGFIGDVGQRVTIQNVDGKTVVEPK